MNALLLKLMKISMIVIAALLVSNSNVFAQKQYEIVSPNKSIKVEVVLDESIKFSVIVDGEMITRKKQRRFLEVIP